MISRFLKLFITVFNLKHLQWHMISGPILLLMILSMMILPLPAFILDLFFTFNIALSIIILLVAMFTKNSLEFISFPSILLFTTLLRLALNIASTRVILLKGHTGSSAAGNVVRSFGHFLVGSNFSIGIVIFVMLIIINFIVITKGAGRIAEVGARFALDGMPGKQMAIDADLNSGLINQKEANKRRLEVNQEAEFYGAMDGASKFVRGDAIAGILIMVINIIGGLFIGIIQHKMFFLKASQTYTLLTIGDGLVAQIPALLISIAAGVMVTRISNNQRITEQMINQLFSDPFSIFFSGCLLGILGLIPGMPTVVFILVICIFFTLGYLLFHEKKNGSKIELSENFSETSELNLLKEVSWNDVRLEDTIRIELGSELMIIADINTTDNLLIKIRGIRKKFAQEIGFLTPSVCIRNNLDLKPFVYKIMIKGAEFSRGEALLNYWLAINTGNSELVLSDKEVIEPVFGLKSFWIKETLKKNAQDNGFTVVDASSMVATHFNHIIYKHMDELFGCYEAQKLLNRVSKIMPKLVEELIPNLINLSILSKILKNLLSEQVSIRDMKTIIETLLEYSLTNKDPDFLTSVVRIALGKSIIQKIFHNNKNIKIIGLDVKLENILIQSLESGQETIEPELANTLLSQTEKAIKNQQLIGAPIVLVVNHNLRSFLSKFLRVRYNEITVLSNMEIKNNLKIYVTSVIGSMN